MCVHSMYCKVGACSPTSQKLHFPISCVGKLGSTGPSLFVQHNLKRGFLPAWDYSSPRVDERMTQYCRGFSAKFQPLIQMLAMQHSTTNVSFFALHISVIHAVITAIPMPSSFLVLLVTLIIGFFTGWTPK